MYLQIMEQIRHRIAVGDWQPGQEIPSIRALAVATAVSVITVKRAYLELERAGVIVTRQGKGRSWRRTWTSARSFKERGARRAPRGGGGDRTRARTHAETSLAAARTLTATAEKNKHMSDARDPIRRRRESAIGSSARDVTLRLEPGQIMGFVGPNGAGKSTTIRILMALDPAGPREVRVLGRSMPRGAGRGQTRRRLRLGGHAPLRQRDARAGTCSSSSRSIPTGTGLRAAAAAAFQPSAGATRSKACRTASASRRRCCSCSRGGRGCSCSTSRPPGFDPVARHEILAELMDVLTDERARDPVLVAQHARRRADLRPDHVHRPRPDHRFERQGDVPRALAPAAARRADRRRAARAAGRHRLADPRPAGGRDDERVHARAARRVRASRRDRSRRAAHDARGDLRRERHEQPQGGGDEHLNRPALVCKDLYLVALADRGARSSPASSRSLVPSARIAFYVGTSSFICVLIALHRRSS